MRILAVLVLTLLLLVGCGSSNPENHTPQKDSPYLEMEQAFLDAWYMVNISDWQTSDGFGIAAATIAVKLVEMRKEQ